MELQNFLLFLLKCEYGRPISSLNEIDQPPWWPAEVTFEEDLLQKTTKKGVSCYRCSYMTFRWTFPYFMSAKKGIVMVSYMTL